MRAVRSLSLAFVAALAVAVAAASAASTAVALPEFTPTGASVTMTAGASILKWGENGIACDRDEVSGSPTVHRFLIGVFRILFFDCTTDGASKTGCEVSSVGAGAAGLIITRTLHIVAVLLTRGRQLVIGERLLPVSGKEWTTLAGNECTKLTPVTGELIGEPLPLGRLTTKGEIDFSAGEEELDTFDEGEYEGGEGNGEYKGLTLFGVGGTIATNEEVGFSAATELT
jgi:hypothetical protein